MAERSEAVSAALVFLPNIFVIAFRISSPEFNQALSNDQFSEILIHSFAIIVGILMMLRYRIVDDHEYRRTKAIGDLSRTYKLEDKGLWEKGDSAIQKLEARAYSDFKGRKGKIAMKRMQSNIGQFNLESREIEEPVDNSSYSIRVSGIDQAQQQTEKEQEINTGIFSKISGFVEKSIQNSASRRLERMKKKEKSARKDDYDYPEIDNDSNWAIPEKVHNRRRAKLCEQCSTYNEPDSSYCNSCGHYMS